MYSTQTHLNCNQSVTATLTTLTRNKSNLRYLAATSGVISGYRSKRLVLELLPRTSTSIIPLFYSHTYFRDFQMLILQAIFSKTFCIFFACQVPLPNCNLFYFSAIKISGMHKSHRCSPRGIHKKSVRTQA